MGDAIVVDAPGFVRGRRMVYAAADIAHAVACVNALHFAGITPAALAADPDCLKKLVEFARDHAWRNGSALDALRACGIEVGP
jgi:hypothetical protein